MLIFLRWTLSGYPPEKEEWRYEKYWLERTGHYVWYCVVRGVANAVSFVQRRFSWRRVLTTLENLPKSKPAEGIWSPSKPSARPPRIVGGLCYMDPGSVGCRIAGRSN